MRININCETICIESHAREKKLNLSILSCRCRIFWRFHTQVNIHTFGRQTPRLRRLQQFSFQPKTCTIPLSNENRMIEKTTKKKNIIQQIFGCERDVWILFVLVLDRIEICNCGIYVETKNNIKNAYQTTLVYFGRIATRGKHTNMNSAYCLKFII